MVLKWPGRRTQRSEYPWEHRRCGSSLPCPPSQRPLRGFLVHEIVGPSLGGLLVSPKQHRGFSCRLSRRAESWLFGGRGLCRRVGRRLDQIGGNPTPWMVTLDSASRLSIIWPDSAVGSRTWWCIGRIWSVLSSRGDGARSSVSEFRADEAPTSSGQVPGSDHEGLSTQMLGLSSGPRAPARCRPYHS